MATANNGIIKRTDSVWAYVIPKCPHCGNAEPRDVAIGIPQHDYAIRTHSCMCTKCRKMYQIPVYPG